MINATHLSGILNGHYIPGGFHDTDGGFIPLGAGTDGTETGIGDVITFFAIADLLPHLDHCISERFHLRNILPEQMQRQPQCALTPDARQLGKFRNGILKKL
jgi:hypothetical protein